MKIKVVSPNAERAEQVAQIVRGSATGLDVHAATPVPGGLQATINGSRPGLLVLDAVSEVDYRVAMELLERIVAMLTRMSMLDSR